MPRSYGGYVPFVPQPYDRSGSTRIAEMMMRSGSNRADAQRYNADVLGRTIAGIGQDVGGILQQRDEQKQGQARAAEMAKRDAAWVSYLESGEWTKDPQSALAMSVRVWGPEEGRKQFEALQSIGKIGKGNPVEDRKALGTIARNLAKYGDPAIAHLWPTIRQLAQSAGQDLPEAFEPQMRPMIESFGALVEEEEYNLTEGSVRMRGDNVVARGPEAPPKPDVRSAEARLLDPATTPEQRATILQTHRELAASGRAPETVSPYKAGLDKLPPELRSAADIIAIALPGTKQEAFASAVSRAASTGNLEGAKAAMRKAATGGLGASEASAMQGRVAMIDSLDDISAMIKEAEAAGAPPGLFQGTVEDAARRLGTTNNPKLRALGTRMRVGLNNYVRAQSGAAFSEKELRNYESVMPSWTSDIAANAATISGMRRALSDWNNSSWTYLLQDEGLARAIGAIREDAPATSPKNYLSTDPEAGERVQ